MNKKQSFYFLTGCFLIWGCLAILIDNSIILPAPWTVLQTMFDQLISGVLFPSFFRTCLRVVSTLVVSFLLGLFTAFFFFLHPVLRLYFEKILLILRSVPNVSMILLVLFWLDREMSVMIVCFLLLYPMIYQNLIEDIKRIFQTYSDVILLDPHTFFSLCFKIFLPLMKTSIKASLISASSLGFKVCAMAEILAQVPQGLGRQIQYARLNVDLASMMGWTIWLLFAAFLFHRLFVLLLNSIWKEESDWIESVF